MAARTLLLKLDQTGWIQLPQRRMKSPTRSGRMVSADADLSLKETPVEGPLQRLVDCASTKSVKRADKNPGLN